MILKPIDKVLTKQTAYYQLSRLMAKNVRIGEYYGRELYSAMQRPAVRFIAELAVAKFFPRGDDTMKVRRDMALLYRVLLVMAPVLQRIPRSLHLDHHRGHVLTWFRVYAGGKAKRRHVRMKIIDRVHNPALLVKRLEELKIRDRTCIKILVVLFRSYYWRDTVAGNLARILFDPIMIEVPRDRHVLRVGNRIYSLHKQGGKMVNLEKVGFVFLDYRLRYDTVTKKVTISLSPEAVADFKKHIRNVMARETSPANKARGVELAIERFTERAKWAKDDRQTITELRGWLRQTLQPLMTPKSGETKSGAASLKQEFGHLPNVLVNKWLVKRSHTTSLIKARHNIFYDLKSVDVDVFLNFLSPYREV